MNRLYRLAFLVIIAATPWVAAMAQDRWNGLERLDQTWVLGYWSTVPNEDFGLTQIDFLESPLQKSLQQITDFDFHLTNGTWTYRHHMLSGNTCVLVDNRLDTIAVHYDQDTLSRLYTVCNRDRSQFKQTLLPVAENYAIFSTEFPLQADLTDGWLFTTQSHIFSRVLLAPNSDATLVDQSSLFLRDSLLEETWDYTSAGDGLGWMGIARSATDSDFHLWRVDKDSIQYLESQSLGPAGFGREQLTTRLNFNPTGDAFAISGSDDGLQIYNFNKQTLEISEREIIPASYDSDFEPYRTGTDCAWSADGRYLYVTSIRHLYQFDTWATDIAASAVQINDPSLHASPIGYYEIERGPDCRMYIGWPGAARALSVIDKPSRPGRACELKDVGMRLETIYFAGLPNYPEYAQWGLDRIANGLAPIVDTAVCDSSLLAHPYTSSSSTRQQVPEPQWNVYPNPAPSGTTLSLRMPAGVGRLPDLSAEIHDVSGRSIATLPAQGFGDVRTVKLPTELGAGIYTLHLLTSGASLGQRHIMVE